MIMILIALPLLVEFGIRGILRNCAGLQQSYNCSSFDRWISALKECQKALLPGPGGRVEFRHACL
jgi:hypothetical protein